MKHFIFLVVTSLLFGLLRSQTAFAQVTRYVSTTGVNSNPASATSWATSTTNLQGAINASQSGDQVWVAAGVYKPGGNANRDRLVSFIMKEGVGIYGGFAGSETVLAQRNLTTNATVLSGDLDEDGRLDNNTHIIIYNDYNSLSASAILDGFIVTGGNANNIDQILLQGGGMYNNFSSPSIYNCQFIANYATNNGGAVGLQGSSSLFVNCSFQNNSSGSRGGAVNVHLSGNSRFINCSFQGNVSPSGGAVGKFYDITTLVNCVFWNNGGANTFANDPRPSNVVVNYCLLEPEVAYFVSGPGNLTTTTSPFVSASSVALNPCSPAINAGNSASYTAATSLTVDLASHPRTVGSSIDMGAVEFQTIPNYPVAFTLSPASGSAICTGSSVSVPIGVTGSATGYQWYKNGTAVVSQTSATLSLPAATTADTGSYSVVVTGSCNSVTSTAFSLMVNALPTLIISSVTVCQGQLVTLMATGCGGGSVAWPTGTMGSTLTLTAGASGSVLTATCTSGLCSTTASGSVIVNGLQPPPAQILSLSADERTCPVRLLGQGVGTSFVVTGLRGYVFSNVYRAGGTHSFFVEGIKQPGTYTLTAVYTNECGSSAPLSQTVTVSRACP